MSIPPPKYILLAILAAALALFALLWLNRQSAENQIRSNMDTLKELVEKSAPESQLLAARSAKQIENHFTASCFLQIGDPFPTLTERRSIMQAFMRFRASVNSCRVSFHDMSVVVADDEQNATMNLTVEAEVDYNGTHEKEYRAFSLEWVYIEKKWLIHTIQPLNTIRR